MKRFVRILSFILLVALGAAFPWFLSQRPQSVQEKLKPPPKQWEGVLSVGIVADFRPGGISFAAYAEKAAARFERENPGILVAVREMETTALDVALSQGNAPDILLFGTGVIQNPRDTLVPLEGSFSSIREEYMRSASVDGTLYAMPVAAGGYAPLANSDWLARAGVTQEMDWAQRLAVFEQGGNAIQCPRPEGVLSAAGLIAVTGGAVLDAPGALPKQLAALPRALCWPDFALEQKQAVYVGTQYEIARMKILESNGRVFAWEVLPAQGMAFTDQVLYAGVVHARYTGRMETQEELLLRTEAAGILLGQMNGEAARQDLISLGLFSPEQDQALYAGVKGMQTLEASLQGPLLVADAFAHRAVLEQAGTGLEGARRYLEQMGYSP